MYSNFIHFQSRTAEHGTDFGSLYTMADEIHKILSPCKSHYIKHVEFFIDETK